MEAEWTPFLQPAMQVLGSPKIGWENPQEIPFSIVVKTCKNMENHPIIDDYH